MKILITGGSGFIGSHLIEKLLLQKKHKLFNIDKNHDSPKNLFSIDKNYDQRYKFIKYNLSDKNQIQDILFDIVPDLIINLAAETHVDRSIDNPDKFVINNVFSTLNLLESTRKLYKKMSHDWQNKFLFYHAGTDEVYGSALENQFFNEESRYDPRSPYAASKASSNFLVQSWFYTYNLPVIIGNCSNNFGPGQFPEKLIPLSIFKALNNQKIPIYGDGEFTRDWIYVKDHINAILRIIDTGKPGNSYCIGANNQRTNNQIIKLICQILDEKLNPNISFNNLISYVEDRPGHDKRYALDLEKIKNEINWEAKYSFNEALNYTVDWYIKNKEWCLEKLFQSNYNCERLGLKDN